MYEVFSDFTILCVDDDKIVLEILKNSFKDIFNHVYVASDGLEGYGAFNKHNPDIIITDINMPILDGMGMIQKIREKDSNVPIYISSAIEDSKVLLKSIELGVSGYVVKPIDIKQLLNKLENSAKLLSYEILKVKHQKELQMFNDSLEDKVNEQTKELEEFNANLQLKIQKEVERNFLASKELLLQKQHTNIAELITNLSHQWRQPLSIISALAGGIKVNRSLGIDDPEQEQKDLNQIVKTTKDLSKTIEKLRVFTKQNRLDRNGFVLNQTIKDVIMILKDRFVEDKVTINTDFKDHIMMDSHAKEFATIMFELLVNAKESINKSNKPNHTLSIMTQNIDENSAEIIIKDSGIGFDKDAVQKVFDPYYSTKFNSSGVGLSLYFVKDHIERLFNGTIKAENYENGAIITITISNQLQGDKDSKNGLSNDTQQHNSTIRRR